MINHTLRSNDPLTQLVISSGIKSWSDLVSHIRTLPYGRNTNRHDFSLVITQAKGSCSSKHALLKQIAILSGLDQVKLVLAIYKMSEANTPGIAPILSDHHLDYIPEAHCFLSINGLRMDYTSINSNIKNLIPDLLEEQEILPEQVNKYKIDYHQHFLRQYIKNNKLKISFEQLWSVREACITQLQANNSMSH